MQSKLTSDRGQLFNMATKARDAIGTSGLNIVADRGYFSGAEILKCHEAGMTTTIPKTVTSSNRKKGQFDKRDFIYIKKDDEYECPAGERLIWRFRTRSSCV